MSTYWFIDILIAKKAKTLKIVSQPLDPYLKNVISLIGNALPMPSNSQTVHKALH